MTKFWGVMEVDPGSSSGVACRSGGAPELIQNPRAKAGEPTVWFTNIRVGRMSELGLGDGYLLPDNFLRVRYNAIVDELGLASMETLPRTEAMANVFQTCMRFTDYVMPPVTFASKALSTDLIPQMARPPLAKKEIEGPLAGALQVMTNCGFGGNPKDKRVMIRLPRHTLASQLLGTLLPAGEWNAIPRKDLPADDLPSWLNSTGKMGLLEVAVKKIDPAVATIFGFGMIGEGKSEKRRFISWPEYQRAAAFMELDVKCVWLAEECVPVRQHLPEGCNVDLLLQPPFSSSWSAGVVLENIRMALQMPLGRADKANASKVTRVQTARSVWLAAVERKILFEHALALHQAGVEVESYISGGIRIRIPEGAEDEVLAKCYKAGVIVPLGLAMQHPQRFLAEEWGGHPNDLMMATLMYGGARDILLKINNPANISSLSSREVLKDIGGASGQVNV